MVDCSMENKTKVRLVFVGMQEVMVGQRVALWDVIRPVLPGYDYQHGYPTMSKEALQEAGILGGK
jgi:hypothetical protein